MERKWWKEGVVYQIYPRSFNDSDGDGIGDLRGIIEKLDYIKSLGVDIIWLCPVYESPNDDNGYDISDYRNIMNEFGSMTDFDELLAGIKSRRMRLLMDLVANHTSDEHEWFLESKSSLDNPKRDYYIWKAGDNGTPPNNWQSIFGGDAWLKDHETGEYFLHLFTKKQPDLNWENPKVRQEIFDIMKFWLDKGIDGFRLDVISFISKRNYDDTPYDELNVSINKIYANGPRIHEFLQEMNSEVISNYDMMTVGEGPGIDLTTATDYVGEDRNELNMVFHFGHMFIDHGPGGKFDPVTFSLQEFKKVFTDWDECLKGNGWSSIFLGNHDFPRIVSRFGNDKQYWKESAKLLATMLCSLRGTTYVYQGDEFGMTNVEFQSFDDFDDVEIKNLHKDLIANGEDLDKFIPIVNKQGRDNARTPIQWSSTENGGFTTGNPWLKMNPNFSEINAESQEDDPESILNFYRQVIQVRKNNLTLVYGDYKDLAPDHSKLYVYERWDENHKFLAVHNFSEETETYEYSINELDVISNNYKELEYSEGKFSLKPWQSVIIKLN